MGYYVNPGDGRVKEQWLEEEGEQISPDAAKSLFDGESENLPVCLVDNGWMTAAGIAYDPQECDVFMRPDGRPKKWYAVSRDKLRQFCPEGVV